LEAVLTSIRDFLQDFVGAVGSSSGPLSGQALSDATSAINGAEGQIDTLRDSGEDPSLNPADIGDVDDTVNPSGLPAHAEAMRDLAQDAVDEEAGNGSHQVMGDKIATIEDLLPTARSLAGIS
jgi:hypothetical protein